MSNNSVFNEKLRSLGLRPTRQRIQICNILFDRENTFHFTIQELSKMISNKFNEKISLATVYNTVQTFKKNQLPKSLKLIPVTKPGSRFIK